MKKLIKKLEEKNNDKIVKIIVSKDKTCGIYLTDKNVNKSFLIKKGDV